MEHLQWLLLFFDEVTYFCWTFKRCFVYSMMVRNMTGDSSSWDNQVNLVISKYALNIINEDMNR